MQRLLILSLILFLVIFSPTISQAQVSKGQWMVGGSGHIDPSKLISIDINPSGAYMVSNKLAIGTILSIGYSSYSEGHALSNYLVPTVRYYFGKSRTQPFVLAGFGIGHYAYFSGNSNNEKHSEFSFYGGAALGLSHFINNNIALEVIAGYSNSPITIYRGIFVNFGFQIFLNKKSSDE